MRGKLFSYFILEFNHQVINIVLLMLYVNNATLMLLIFCNIYYFKQTFLIIVNPTAIHFLYGIELLYTLLSSSSWFYIEFECHAHHVMSSSGEIVETILDVNNTN